MAKHPPQASRTRGRHAGRKILQPDLPHGDRSTQKSTNDHQEPVNPASQTPGLVQGRQEEDKPQKPHENPLEDTKRAGLQSQDVLEVVRIPQKKHASQKSEKIKQSSHLTPPWVLPVAQSRQDEHAEHLFPKPDRRHIRTNFWRDRQSAPWNGRWKCS